MLLTAVFVSDLEYFTQVYYIVDTSSYVQLKNFSGCGRLCVKLCFVFSSQLELLFRS